MSGYQSHLTVVIDARRTKQEVMQRDLAVIKGQLLKEDGLLQKWMDSSEAAMDGLSKHQQTGGTPSEMSLYYQFVKRQAEKIQAQRTRLSELEAVYEKKRRALEIATQEKIMVEKIEEKRKQAYMARLRKKESDLLDEMAGQMRWRTS